MLKLFVFYALLFAAAQASLPDTIAKGLSSDCLTNSLENNSLYCRGSRAIRNVIHNLNKNDKPLVIVRGLEIVANHEEQSTNASATKSNESDDDSFLGLFSQYLRTHELNIRFSELLANESERFLAHEGSGDDGGAIEEARKKDKGQGMMLAMALMFGKLMAVMGMGGIGMMAMKALGVAMAALMMAAMVGLKSLSQHGQESSHSVQYVSADGGHHHKRRRRRRSADQDDQFNPLPLVYSGWLKDGGKSV